MEPAAVSGLDSAPPVSPTPLYKVTKSYLHGILLNHLKARSLDAKPLRHGWSCESKARSPHQKGRQRRPLQNRRGRPPLGPRTRSRQAQAHASIPCTQLSNPSFRPPPLIPAQAFQIPKPKPLTEKEKSQVAHFRKLRESIKNGPLYTVLGDNVRVGKSGTSAAAAFNPFEGMPKYSQRYTKKKRMIPKLDTRPYGSCCYGDRLVRVMC